MELQNSTLLGSYALKEDGLRRLEEKSRYVINSLKKECKRLDENEARVVSMQKALKLKQAREDYTVKLPETRRKLPRCNKEVFKNGWRVRNESEITEKAREKLKLRSQMVLVGNGYSMTNKAERSARVPRSKSIDEVKKEMIVKSRMIGNHYSQAFMRKRTRVNSNYSVRGQTRPLVKNGQAEKVSNIKIHSSNGKQWICPQD